MSDDIEFSGSVPELYDRLMVPMIFAEPAAHDAARIEDDVVRAGFTAVAIEEVGGTSAATAEDAAVAYCQGTPLRAAIEGHPTVSLTGATQAAAEALRREFGSGALTGRTGWIEVVARARGVGLQRSGQTYGSAPSDPGSMRDS